MRRGKTGRLVCAGALLALCACLWALAFSLVGAAQQSLPSGVVFRSAQGLAVDITGLAKAERLAGGLRLAACRVSQGTATAGAGEYAVELVHTVGSWGQVMPPALVRGSWYAHSAVPEENHHAVISHELALALFFTDDVVGRTLRVDGLQLLVTGVLPPQGALAGPCGSGLPQVYLPMLQPGAPASSLRPMYLYAANTDGAATLQPVQQLAARLEQALQHPLSYESASQYGQALAVADTLIGAGIFLCALVAAACLLWVAARRAVRLWRDAKAANGLRDATRRHRAVALGILLAALAACGLLWAARFHFYLPPDILPTDNIFDVGHYFEAITQQVQQNNRFAAHDAMWTLSQRALAWQAAACAAATATFGLLCRNLLVFWVHY